MYSAVYRLRERGIRLPKPKDAVSGELRLRPHQVGTNDTHALLAELVGDGGGIALPPLHGAIVRRVTKGGMVMRGKVASRVGRRGGSSGLPALCRLSVLTGFNRLARVIRLLELLAPDPPFRFAVDFRQCEANFSTSNTRDRLSLLRYSVRAESEVRRMTPI